MITPLYSNIVDIETISRGVFLITNPSMRQKVSSKFLSLFPSLRVEITATNVSTNNQKRNDGGKRMEGAIKYTITKDRKRDDCAW